ncbi:hypothetical protein [Streptomyces sp. NRRL B-24484]|uniref:hypothetical protein n=1 Tax=Streptomyces sp. NRRL B-24484 TaxID=1463833 RepID=UPI000A9B3F07|nr:hypothetical protein [Streptomyces sp. NRRL B-24484]
MSTESAVSSVGSDRPVEFVPAWCGTDLGVHRPCRGTYEWYPYESLPPAPADRFDGGFGWLGGVGPADPERVALLDGVVAALAGTGCELPADFVALQTSARCHDVLDEVSVTACWTDVSQPLPSPFEPGARLVRFLRDQQDCVFWYLYLRPAGKAFVVGSPLDFARLPEWEEAEGPADLSAAVARCAASFEEFAHRFWVENRLWQALQHEEVPAAPEFAAYLAHYTDRRTGPVAVV